MFNTVVGTAIYALGILFFIDPAKLYSGGVTGLSQLIVNVVELISNNNIHINLGILSFVLQVPLLVFAYFKLNGRFVFYTIVSVVVFTLILLFKVNEPLMGSDMLTNALVGGILGGIGNGSCIVSERLPEEHRYPSSTGRSNRENRWAPTRYSCTV